MNFTRPYQILFFMGLLSPVAHICAMDVQKNYAFAIKDPSSRCCIFPENDDRELPFLVPDKKPTSFLTQTAYDEFKSVCLFAKAMIENKQLPQEIIDLIKIKSRIIADQSRNIWVEQILQDRNKITYQDLCYATHAQKQLLLYCAVDAAYNNGILTIEGSDATFSREILERFYSLHIATQAKLARHSHGMSLYVKTSDMRPSLCNRLLGQDVITRNRNIARLASTAKIIVPIALLTALIMTAVKTLDAETFEKAISGYADLVEVPIKVAFAIVEKCVALRVPKLVMMPMVGITVSLGFMVVCTLPYVPFIAVLVALVVSGSYAGDYVLNTFTQTLSDMHYRGFKEIVVAPERNEQ